MEQRHVTHVAWTVSCKWFVVEEEGRPHYFTDHEIELDNFTPPGISRSEVRPKD